MLALGLALGVACESDTDTRLGGKAAQVKPVVEAPPAAVDDSADAGRQPVPTPPGDGDQGGEQEEDEGEHENTPQLTEAEVMTFFKDSCGECHGEDDQGNKAANFSSWPMGRDALSLDGFETSVFAPIVYAALHNKVGKNPSSSPSQMPPRKLSKDERATVRGVLGWFNVNLAFVVAEAEQSYGIKSDTTSGATTLRFQCEKPISTRQFLARMTTALFDRNPTLPELGEYSAEELAAPVTKEIRQKIVGKLRKNDWKSDFIENGGLRKLADAIGGGPAIPADSDAERGFVPGTAADLKQEFFQLMRLRYDTWDYEQFLTTSKIMVTQRTAPLYGCTPPAEADEWIECGQEMPRGGFFTTLGYLNSKPSSFLRENNNYGRVATMYLTLMGQGFKAATNGPAGGDVAPLPDCLEPDDTRRRTDAARDTVAIPSFGNICQSCHISRNLAAGSVLFRPYATNGQVYDQASFGDFGMPDKADFDQAVAPDWTFGTRPRDPATRQVDAVYLRSLLEKSVTKSKVKACAVTGNKKEPTVKLETVNDLAKYLMRNKSAVVRGFVRHAHRAYAISQSVNFDLVYTAIGSYGAGKKKIPDLLEAYFGSETFACAAEE